jgi:phage terminase large subunit GpA-like protein
MGSRDCSPEELAQADAILERVWGEFCAPPPNLTVTEWAEANRVLSAKDSAEPGPYRIRRTPYAREPQDCLGARSQIEEVVLMWGAQTSKTTVGTNWIGYTIDHNPGPIMVLWPTINVAKRNSRQRLTPMFDATPSLRRKVAERKAKDEANTMLLKDFAGGVLAIVGANSGSDLSSMPMRDIFMDEVDRFPVDIPGEGKPSELAEARQTTYPRRKRLKTSTPTIRHLSDIESAFEASDKSRYHVPCPHCGELQPLEWGSDKPHGLKWDKDETGKVIRSSIRYVCRVYGCEIQEHHKTKMLADGRWVAENPGAQDGKVRGFHLSSLYSPLGWLSWYDLVRQWVAAMAALAKGDPSKLRVFINTRLADTYEDQGEKANESDLRKRAADIPLRVVQWGHFVNTMSVDVQVDRLHIHIWAWGRGMRRQLVDRHVIYGNPALAESEAESPWADLTEYRRTPVLHVSGQDAPLLGCMIDSSNGNHTQAIYAYARAHKGERVMAVKGQSVAGKAIVGKPTLQEVNWRGDKVKKGVSLWPIGTDVAKTEIYGRLRVATPGPGYVLISRHVHPETFEQITSERLVTKYDARGRSKREWVKPAGKANEDLDCAVYGLACAHWAGIDRWKEGDWSKWQARVEPPQVQEAPKPEEEPHPLLPPEPPAKKSARRTRGRLGGWGAR